MNFKTPALIAAATATATLILSGCFGMQGQTSLEPMDGAAEDGARTQPFVEAFVEYPGPSERWAGPATFLLHVSAKEDGYASVQVVPESFNSWSDPNVEGRVPASGPVVELSSGAVREYLANLARALEMQAPEFKGCLSPVHVRLVRADGKVAEKHGCRGISGWPKAVSDAVSYFMVSATAQSARKPAAAEERHAKR